MEPIKRATGTTRLTDAAIRAWLRKPLPDALHDGGGLYLRRRADGAFWTLRQVNATTGARTWAALFPNVSYPTATLGEARRKASEARLAAAARPTGRAKVKGSPQLPVSITSTATTSPSSSLPRSTSTPMRTWDLNAANWRTGSLPM